MAVRPCHAASHETAGFDAAEQPPAPGTVETRKVHGVDRRVRVGPVTASCGGQGFELAKNTQQELYAIERQPKHATPDYLTACGCQQDYHFTCGGAAVRPVQMLHLLPDDLTYQGVVTIEYALDPDTVLLAGRQPRRWRVPASAGTSAVMRAGSTSSRARCSFTR